MRAQIFIAGLICAISIGAYAAPADRSPNQTLIRPEVTQLLNQATRLSNAIHPDKAAIMAKLQEAATVPNISVAEKNRVVHIAHQILGNRGLADVNPNLSETEMSDQNHLQP
jgi:hypothetical protein